MPNFFAVKKNQKVLPALCFLKDHQDIHVSYRRQERLNLQYVELPPVLLSCARNV